MDFDKLFKEYCLKQNPSETVSGGCAMFVLGFVDFLKEQAVEHGVQADEGDSSDEEEFTNPYLLSGEELDRTIALRR